MDAGNQNVKMSMATESLDLVEFAAKIWAEGGYRSRKKKKAKTKLHGKVGVDGMTVNELELEYDSSDDD